MSAQFMSAQHTKKLFCDCLSSLCINLRRAQVTAANFLYYSLNSIQIRQTFSILILVSIMSGLNKYFKSTKSNPIEEEFIRQLEQAKKDSNGPDDERDKEKQKFESTINSLENENRDIRQKYERLKAKHVQLLQVLLSQEQKIQTLEARCANLNENKNTLKTYSNCDLLAELVISYFILP